MYPTFRHSVPFSILFLVLLSFSCFADIQPVKIANSSDVITKFKYFNKEHGLEHSTVAYIAEDKLGFIWLGTPSGVYRFDGHYFKSFTPKNSGLSNGFVTAILIDSVGTIWVGTESGLNRYDAKLERFVPILDDILKNKHIRSVFEDKDNRMWIGTDDGLFLLKNNSQSFETLRFKIEEEDVVLKEVNTIYQDKSGMVWISTDRGSNYLIDPLLNKLYRLNAENPLNINLKDEPIKQIVATKNSGLLLIKNKEILLYSGGVLELLYTITDTTVLARSVVDKDNVIWVSSNNGILRFVLENDQLKLIGNSEKHQRFFDLYIDRNMTIWFGSLQNGIGQYTYKSRFFSQVTTANNILADDVVWSIKEGKKNEIWIAGNSPILTQLNLHSKENNKFDSNLEGIKTLAVEENGDVFIGAGGGLYKYSINSNNFESSQVQLTDFEMTYLVTDEKFIYASSWGRGFFRIPRNSSSNELEKMTVGQQSLPYITTLQINGKMLYAGTLNGMYVFDLVNGVSREITELSGKRVSYIYADKTGVYVSTGSGGVFVFNQNLSTLVTHYDSPALMSRAIYSVLKAPDNSLWLSTDNGILNIKDDIIIQYDTSDGLQGIDFNDNSALASRDGLLFFGGVNGLNFIDPRKKVDLNSNKPSLVFTRFTVFNNPVVINEIIDDNVRLPESIISTQEIVLDYSDYPFELTYNLVNYPQPNKIQYRYKLIDLDNDWLNGKATRTATYTNLASGTYSFEVEALDINSGEVIAKNKMRIVILPPWWLSSIALSIYFFVFFIVTLIIMHIVRQRKQSAKEIHNAAERLKLSLWGSGDLMWDWNLVNGSVYQSEHWQQFDYEGLNERSLLKVHPKDRQKVKERLELHLADESEFFEANYRIKRRDDSESWVWIVDRAKVVERTSTGLPLRMAGTIRDITLLKDAEVRLNLQANVMSNISDAIYVMDLQFNIVDVNKAFSVITGLSMAQVIGNKRVLSTYHGGVSTQIQERLKKGLNWVGEAKAEKPNGDFYYIELHVNPMLDNDNEVSHYVAAFSDITQRKSTERELRNLSNIDPLTKLPNRSYFQYAHRNLIRRKEPHALLTMDIDNFKKVNDSMGHDEGDKLLCMIAERIDSRINCQHLLCRLGGDEFALLLEDINDISMITQVLYDIEGAMQDPFYLLNEVLVMNCSIGVAIYPNDGETTENMLQSSDTAMYHAKSETGFSYQFFNTSMNESAVRRLQVESMIRQALKNDWFEVYYQPKVDMKTEMVMGMEALVRLVHPELGMISPSEFIPIAEDTGLVIAIGEKVLDKACYATQQWRKNGLFNGRVAVNLAAKQFSQVDLLQRIEHIIECTQLPMGNLELEITESTVIDNPEVAIVTMQKLADKGIHLALDDFGTGYSSLSYLRRFPIHTLKIDKAFIDDLTHEKNERHMVASIISIAHNMNVSVVAEGVEELVQLEALRQLSCETIQGYYYSRPLSEQDFTSYLLKNNAMINVGNIN